MTGLSAHLRSLADPDLAALLAQRPDVLHRPPSGFDDLAARLSAPQSCLLALQRVDVGAAQVAGLLVAAGMTAGADALTQVLAGRGPVDVDHVPAALHRLAGVGLAWPDGGGWRGATGMRQLKALPTSGPARREPQLPPPAPADPAVGAAAALALVDAVRALLRHLDAAPPKVLATGGLGVQVQRGLAKALGTDQERVGWLLDLAGSAGLLGAGPDAGRLTRVADGWLGMTADLAYVLLAGPVLEDAAGPRALAGENAPPLSWMRYPVRHLPRLADVARRAPSGRDDDVVAHLRWQRWTPEPSQADALRDRLVQLERLALRSGGHATPWLAALLDDASGSSAARALAAALPPEQDDAVWQADGTAVVVGRPSAALAQLLGAVAERESDRTWRVSASATRAALDAGRTADELCGQLHAASRHPLPQAVEQLVRDVAARHGRIRVVPAKTLLLVEDPVLVVELLRDARLRALGLEQVAPGLLACTKAAADALAGLRAAGHAPTGPAVARRKRVRQAATSPYAAHGPADAAAVVVALRAAPDRALAAPGRPRAPSRAASLLARTPQLGDSERLLLLAAVQQGRAVEVDYRDSAGQLTTRVLEDLADTGYLLEAWCRLRGDERAFDPAGLQAVRAAD